MHVLRREPSSWLTRLRAILVGLLLRQVHPLLREGGDIPVIDVLPCHVLVPGLAIGDFAMLPMSEMYVLHSRKSVKIHMSISP
jgi:hypothetical protein